RCPAASPQALEDHYSPSRWSPRLDRDTIIDAHLAVTAAGADGGAGTGVRSVPRRRAAPPLPAGTERARASGQTLLHVPYGDGDGEKLDIYFPTEPCDSECRGGGDGRGRGPGGHRLTPLCCAAFPALVYIHGGYWQCLSKDDSGFAAPPLVSRGVAVVAVGYDIAPKGRMDTMVLQVRRSLAFLQERYPSIRGIYLCGHSAGAHLAAMVLSTDWTEFRVVPDIKGAVLVSGLYDLEPILHTYVNDALSMSREVAQRNSPVRLVTPAALAACEVLVAGRWSWAPCWAPLSPQALRAAGWSVSLLDLAAVDHFDVIERLSEDSYVLTQVGRRAVPGR
ncbi:KFA formamidase, partial [Calcarius ornatus]|nr:KFA formamidase [Calcarius ornatus]